MPWGSLERPALGISLLKAGLTRNKKNCDIRYLTNLFAKYIGFEEYKWISTQLPHTAFVGEWVFSSMVCDEMKDKEEEYMNEVLRKTWQLDERSIHRILSIKNYVPHFLDYCMQVIPWKKYTMVGFTSTFEQNMASLALAKLIKKKFPKIITVFGGANFEGEMGLELHSKFSFIDFVCSGEADESFPALINFLDKTAKNDDALSSIKGIVYRNAQGSHYTGQAEMIRDMDQLPIPDFSDYFNEMNDSPASDMVYPAVLMETSRGCWWGEKSHCTFCGLNGGSLSFRSKTAQRALDEILFLTEQWQTNFVEIVDNILDMKYFKNFLPSLAQLKNPLSLYYEVKANLNRKQIQILYAAGVHRIQPGIESMSNHILSLMLKGTSALRNIQLLKWCKEYNIGVDWNVLYGFPGETQQDYDEMLELFPSIRFLQPPGACGPIRLDRFSPYYDKWQLFGFTRIRPIVPYRFLYPFNDECLSKVAYYFDYDYISGIAADTYVRKVLAYINEWQQNPEVGSLSAFSQSADKLILIDTRQNACNMKYELSSAEKKIYDYCDEMRTIVSIKQHLQNEYKKLVISDEVVKTHLKFFIINRLMVTDGDHYLSLALYRSTKMNVQKSLPDDLKIADTNLVNLVS